ncbi:MAG: outer membrane lipoprotein carrier protein LolA [Aestuariivirga sp.]|jgi:outer membrane lipoprotein-sorting protein
MAVVILALLMSIAGSFAVEAKQAPMALSTAQQQSIRKLNDYLNSFQSLKADFVQVSSKGNMAQGQMLIAKPGKLRFEYAPPNPLLIVSDGRWLTIKDKVKEKGDQFPLSSTPLRLVVAPQIDLLAETDVIGFDSTDGLTSVSFVDRKGSLGGYITLVYDEQRNQLIQWVVVDGKGRHTTVQLTNIVLGGSFDPKLFVSKIDRGTP